MSRPSGGYAARTEVTVEKTRSEIETLLRSNQAERIVTMDEPSFFVVGFVIQARWFKIEVGIDIASADQIRRSKWRALLLVIKAKLEAVAQHISTVEDEFMSAAVMPNGQTVKEWIAPQLDDAYATGAMPLLLPDYNSGRR